ncbi:hypothetical protein OIU77_019827 [Salix suchowensis]|uniref:Secreted protein n=1 Tax=Salix suchowensis TaxID=1278906 RepID=A0ABQ9CHJ2_9ROSI|nr:hypothetical protein OIU77_019827 [Salix suchowensis]
MYVLACDWITRNMLPYLRLLFSCIFVGQNQCLLQLLTHMHKRTYFFLAFFIRYKCAWVAGHPAKTMFEKSYIDDAREIDGCR